MGILDGTYAAPQIGPDIAAMLPRLAANQQPMQQLPQIPAQPMQQPQQSGGPKTLDAMTAQKNPQLVVPGVIVNGHVYKGGDKADEANWEMLTGDQFLATIPASERLTVKQMTQGRMPFPGARTLTTPYWQQKLQEAQQFDPNFDAATWETRVKTQKDYTPGGKMGQTLQSGSTGINHLGHLYDQIPDVAGMSIPLIGNTLNHAINAWHAPEGHLNPYKDTQGHVSEEVTKFYRGTGGNEADIERGMANLDPDLSRTAKEAGAANTVSLIFGKLKPAADAYNAQMGTNFPPSHFISPDAVKTLKKMGFDPDTGERVSKPASGSGGGSVPQGVDPKIWQHMTPQERSLWGR